MAAANAVSATSCAHSRMAFYCKAGAYFAFFFLASDQRAMTAALACALVRALRGPDAFPPFCPIAAAAADRGIVFPQ
jgi:hypothetical protein